MFQFWRVFRRKWGYLSEVIDGEQLLRQGRLGRIGDTEAFFFWRMLTDEEVEAIRKAWAYRYARQK